MPAPALCWVRCAGSPILGPLSPVPGALPCLRLEKVGTTPALPAAPCLLQPSWLHCLGLGAWTVGPRLSVLLDEA